MNSCHTPIEELDCDKKIKAEIVEYLDSVKYLSNLVSDDRRYCVDMPKDDNGKIVVDLTNPHIIEDIDYFRQSAIHYEKYANYTLLHANKNPNSQWWKFWKEEAKRCREGYIRESDGEWITGYHYFYLNYSPILKVSQTKAGRTTRISGFPDFRDEDYLYYHMLDQAALSGKHVNVLKVRGSGYSFKAASGLSKVFKLGDTQESTIEQTAFAIADESEYLNKDGVLNKFEHITSFLDENTPWPRLRLTSTINKMVWKMGFKDDLGKDKGTFNSIQGVTLKNDSQRARGKRGCLIFWEEFGDFVDGLTSWQIARPSVEDGDFAFGIMVSFGTGGCVCAGTKVWDTSGNLVNIENLEQSKGILGFKNGIVNKETITYWQDYTIKDCVKITTNTGRILECSTCHPIYSAIQKNNKGNISGFTFKPAGNLEVNSKIGVIDNINIFGENTIWQPRTVGWLIGDGSYRYDSAPSFSNCEIEILDFLYKNHSINTKVERLTKDDRIYKELTIRGITKELRKLGIFTQTGKNKRLPSIINSCTKETICELIGGLWDTDGYINLRYNKKRNTPIVEISISQCQTEILDEIRFLLQKLGIHGRIRKRLPRESNPKDKNPWYEFVISDSRSAISFAKNIKLFPKEKQLRLNRILEVFKDINPHLTYDGFRTERIVHIESIGKKEVYNLTADDSNTYIANGIITHNTIGSGFRALEEMFYHPLAYNVLQLRNVWDKNTSEDSRSAFFVPAYMNRMGCYDKNGNSDVTKALVQILKGWHNIRNNTSDLNIYLQAKAEIPIVPQDAMLKKLGSIFPTADLKDYLSEILPELTNFVSSHYVGKLSMSGADGSVYWSPYHERNPIREYPLGNREDKIGCVEIFQQPIKGISGVPQRYRYIAGIDPVDDDYSTTDSLPSIFIFDRLTDKIVAEYTGRPRLANEFYDTCLRLLKYYNAVANYENDKKGLYGYFSNRNALHFLCDTPKILKDMDMVKDTLAYGNKKKGTNSGKQINSWGRQLQADWLISQAYGEAETYVNEDGEEITTEPKLNLQKLRSIGYIRELIAWTPDVNADRVSAMGMCMILRADLEKQIVKTTEDKTKGLANDPFFNRTYGLTSKR